MLLPNLRVVLALGQIAFDAYLRLLRQQQHGTDLLSLRRLRFRHGQVLHFHPSLPVLITSYHPSRQNTQTGRLTAGMLDDVLAQVHMILAANEQDRGSC